jgi:hypothetical protein
MREQMREQNCERNWEIDQKDHGFLEGEDSIGGIIKFRGLILMLPSIIPSIHQDSYGIALIIYAAFFSRLKY